MTSKFWLWIRIIGIGLFLFRTGMLLEEAIEENTAVCSEIKLETCECMHDKQQRKK